MLRIEQGIATSDIEVAEVDVVQEHVDAGQVVGSGVDLLTEEPATHVLGAQDLGELEQERTGTAGRVVDLVDARTMTDDDAREKLRHFLRGEELAARLTRLAGVHVHEVLVGIAEQIDACVPDATKVEVSNALDDLGEARVPLHEVATELVGGNVHVVEQALEAVFGRGAHAGTLDSLEDLLDVDVELRVPVRCLGDIREQLRGQDEVAHILEKIGASRLGIIVGKLGIGEGGVARLVLAGIDVLGKVLGNEAVEQEAEDIRLEVPAVHRAAHFVCNSPDGLVKLGTLGLPVGLSHGQLTFPLLFGSLIIRLLV